MRFCRQQPPLSDARLRVVEMLQEVFATNQPIPRILLTGVGSIHFKASWGPAALGAA